LQLVILKVERMPKNAIESQKYKRDEILKGRRPRGNS
jgi:hypothetical protein